MHPWIRAIGIVVLLSVWFVQTAGTVLLNKVIFHALNFPYPLTLTSVHFLFTSTLSWVLYGINRRILARRPHNPCSFLFPYETQHTPPTPPTSPPGSNPDRVASTPPQQQPAPLTWRFIFTKLFPLAALIATSLGFGNLSIHFLGASLNEVVHSLKTVFVVVLTLVVLRRKQHPLVYVLSFALAGGVVLASLKRDASGWKSHVAGICFAATAMLTGASKSVFQELRMKPLNDRDPKLTPLHLLCYTETFGLVLLLPFALGFEWRVWGNLVIFRDVTLPWVIVASGLCAFIMNWGNYVVTVFASAIFLEFMGTLKSASIVLVACTLFEEKFGWWVNLLGIAGVYLMLLLYAFLRYHLYRTQQRQQLQQASRAQQTREEDLKKKAVASPGDSDRGSTVEGGCVSAAASANADIADTAPLLPVMETELISLEAPQPP